jgi:hypothetical protein
MTALSREAAQECSPRRKPWGKPANQQAPAGRKNGISHDQRQRRLIRSGLQTGGTPVIAKQIPSLFVRRPVIRRAVSVQRDRVPLRVEDQSPRNDEPNVFEDEVSRQEIKVSPLVKFAIRARMDTANVSAIGLAVGRGLYLHPHKASAGLDDHVVARRISPRLGQAQTLFGGSRHKLKLRPLAAPLAILDMPLASLG